MGSFLHVVTEASPCAVVMGSYTPAVVIRSSHYAAAAGAGTDAVVDFVGAVHVVAVDVDGVGLAMG